MQRVYLVFHSTHETLKAEATLQARSVPCRVVMKPAGIRMDCGLAVRVEPAACEAALAALQGAGLQPRGTFTL